MVDRKNFEFENFTIRKTKRKATDIRSGRNKEKNVLFKLFPILRISLVLPSKDGLKIAKKSNSQYYLLKEHFENKTIWKGSAT